MTLFSTQIIMQAYNKIKINGTSNLIFKVHFIKFKIDVLTVLCKIEKKTNRDMYMIEAVSLVENIPM